MATQKKAGGSRAASGGSRSSGTGGRRTAPSSKSRSGSRRQEPAPRPYRRELGAVACLLLAIFASFGYFNMQAIFIDLFCNLLKGLLGYGFWLTPPALLLGAYILAFHRGRPVRLRLVCALLLFIQAGDALEATRTGMALKLAQIPAYLVIFGVGVACVITIFTIGISLLLALLDMASLFLTGLVGLGAVQRCRRAGLLTGRQAVFHGLLQFVPCADVVSSVMVFRRVKAATRGN